MGDRSGKWNIRPCIRPRDIAAVKRSCNLMFPVAEWLNEPVRSHWHFRACTTFQDSFGFPPRFKNYFQMYD